MQVSCAQRAVAWPESCTVAKSCIVAGELYCSQENADVCRVIQARAENSADIRIGMTAVPRIANFETQGNMTRNKGEGNSPNKNSKGVVNYGIGSNCGKTGGVRWQPLD